MPRTIQKVNTTYFYDSRSGSKSATELDNRVALRRRPFHIPTNNCLKHSDDSTPVIQYYDSDNVFLTHTGRKYVFNSMLIGPFDSHNITHIHLIE